MREAAKEAEIPSWLDEPSELLDVESIASIGFECSPGFKCNQLRLWMKSMARVVQWNLPLSPVLAKKDENDSPLE